MKKREIKQALIAVLLGVTLTAAVVAAQDKPEQAGAKSDAAPQPQQVRSSKEYVGPTADSIRPYRLSGRDPFKKIVKPKGPRAKAQARLLGFPTLEVRRADFRQKVEQARARNTSEPDPVMQYLVSELEVTGVFQDERGHGAFVRAQPSGTMFFIRRGVRCFNGEVVSIGGDASDPGSAKVVVREISYTETHGKQAPQE